MRKNRRSGTRLNLVEALETRLCLDASASSIAPAAAATTPTRIVENLDRGVVAVRASTTQVFVSWRLLGLEASNVAFNVYRSANGAAPVKLNGSPLAGGTNYTDAPPSLAVTNAYSVRAVVNGVEQAASPSFTLKANAAVEPVVRVPLTAPIDGYRTKSIWVGDLNGDGEYDYVVDRLAPFYVDPVTGVENNDIGTGNQFLEAFTSKGVKLWTIDLGPTSRGTYNISPGAATISMGMWDGVTVQDLNGDGKAEVVLKIANGVKFADGTTFTTTNNERQFISVVNGLTGAKMAHAEFPADHAFAGRLSTMLGAGYLDGVKPSIVGWLRNRNPDTSAYGAQRKQFNDIMIAWDWDGGSTITTKWKLPLKAGDPAAAGVAGFHQMRIIDVNGDGHDDVLPGNYAISGATGQILYRLAGIGHGDRFHVGDFDPDRPGLEGYGIQQNDGKHGQPGAILDYYYDANDGQMLWTHTGIAYDVGRGAAGDIDPSRRGYEVWSFEGIHNAPTNTLIDDDSNNGVPWPNLRIWWDGDLGSEELDATVINKYNPTNKTTGRLVTGYRLGATTNENFPMIYGDLMGDWREEAVYMNGSWSELIILTTNVPTATRLYTLAHNPAYRNGMTVKGYYQSNHVDYYLGHGMTAPPTPNIRYAGTVPAANSAYQAESAVRSTNVLIESNYGGYNGTGFANFPSTDGSLTWNNIDAGLGGTTTIGFRYALGAAASRTGRLTINGVAQTITFAPTGGWGQWSTVTVAVPLNAGATNTIRLDSTGSDLANVDELQVTALPSAVAPTLVSAVSRKTHGTVGTYDLPIAIGASAPTVEQRVGGAGKLVFTFSEPVSPVDGVLDASEFTLSGATFGSAVLSGVTLTLNLVNVADKARTTVVLKGLRNAAGTLLAAATPAVIVRSLYGDANQSGGVNVADILRLQQASGQAVSLANYLLDLNASGTLNVADILVAQNRSGNAVS
ncbi:MAG TPA: carbohydrate-binding protein [Tepidisphaeraceae bacterium]